MILLTAAIFQFGCAGDIPSEQNGALPMLKPQPQDQPRVGLVDMQRLSDAFGISEQLSQKRQKLQEAWNQVDNDTRESISAALGKFGGDVENLSADQKTALQKLQLERSQRLAEVKQKNNSAMQETNRWLRRVLAEKTKGPIDAVGESMEFDLILVRAPGQVAFIREGIDVTDKVLQRAGILSDTKNTEGNVGETAESSD